MNPVTIVFPQEYISKTSYLQYTIVLQADVAEPVTWDATVKRLYIVKNGKRAYKCNLEDGFIVAGMLQFSVGDASENSELIALLRDVNTNVEGTVELKLDGTVVFSGTIRDDSISIDIGTRVIEMEARPRLDIINRLMLRNFAGTSTNPFGYTLPGTDLKLTEYITDIFKLVNEDCTLTVKHDWLFAGFSSGDPEYLDDGTLEELRIDAAEMYSSPFKYGTTAGGILKGMAQAFFCKIGMLDNKHAFMKKLFYFDETDLQALGKVFKYKLQHQYHRFSYVRIQPETGGVGAAEHFPSESAFTTLEGDYLELNIYDEHFTIDRPGNLYQYIIGKASDPLINPGASWTDLKRPAYLVGWLWYHFRGELNITWADYFLVEGVDYDYLKGFVYDNKKYQILELTNNYENNTSEIVALYLGEMAI